MPSCHISRRGGGGVVSGNVTSKQASFPPFLLLLHHHLPVFVLLLLLLLLSLLHGAAGGDITRGVYGVENSGDDEAKTLPPVCAGDAEGGEGEEADRGGGVSSGSGDDDDGGGGGGGGGETDDAMECVSPAHRSLSWEDAHHYCRGLDGFLPSRDEYHLLNKSQALFNGTSLTWTALTPLNGHYQWLSRCPEYQFFSASTDFTAWRGGRVPRAWDRSCAALDLTTMEFQLTPCNTSLPVLCVRHSRGPAGVGEGTVEDVRLVVEADMPMGPEGNLDLTRDDFAKLGLTCTAYSTRTGQPLSRQPPVFWRKDLVYSGHCAASLLPATLHDPTKSPAVWGPSGADTLVTQQGTYWCEAWGLPGASDRLVSNKVLLTLQDMLVFIVEAHRREGADENVTDVEAKDQLRNAFFHEIGSIYTHTLDLVAANKRRLPGTPPALLATYTFHLHVPRAKISVLWQTKEEALQYQARKLSKVLKATGYENNSSVRYPDLCLSHTSPGEGEEVPELQWPATFIGPVYPTNMLCEVPYGRLAAVGRCVWNFTHGARLVYEPHPCRWRNLCPEGFVVVARRYCVTWRSSVTWEEGFQAVHTTSQEVSLLNDDVLQRDSEWQEMKQLMQEVAATDEVWLPDRRTRAGGPLQHLGPLPRAGYNLTHNIAWAEGHPQPDKECLALNLSANTLYTRPCHTLLPFPALVKAKFLSSSITSWPELSEERYLCHGWRSPIFRGTDEVCFNLFKGVGNLTWGEARAFCQEQEADLPTPNIGFLDWVYRQELNRQGVEGVWMYPHWVPERVVYSGPADTRQDFLGWAVDTNYTLPHGELTPRGWLLRGNETRQDVLCQRLLRTKERLSLKVLPPAFLDADSLCVRAEPMEMLAGREKPNFSCYMNGRPARLVNQSMCVAEVMLEGSGYYQCQGWTVAPVSLVASNSLLQAPASLTFLVTLLEPEARYRPLLHDATFTTTSLAQPPSCGCCDALSAALQNPQVKGMECLPAVRHHYLASPDGRLMHGLHVECGGVPSTQEEPQVLEALSSVLAPGRQVGTCTVDDIRGTQGCDKEVTVDEGKEGTRSNLTWLATIGARQVVPEEPCVTPAGEPVTRECVGDFLLGYQWGPAGHCTGTASNLTRKLWLASREAQDSLSKTEAVLAANISELQPVDIFLVAKSLEAAAELPPPDLSLAQLVSVMDSVLAADTAAFLPVQQRLGSSDTLLTAFEKLFLKTKTDEERKPRRVSRDHVAVESLTLAPESPVVGYKSRQQSVRGLREETLLAGVSEVYLEDAAAAIILPPNISQRVVAQEEREGRTVADVELPLTFAVYRNDKLFQDNESSREVDGSGQRYQVNSDVIQATFGTEVRGLQEPVTIYFKPRLPGNDTKCVFWDLRARGHRGGWSEEGCRSGGRKGDLHVCLCDHLTCFAELINYDQSAGFSGTHAAVLDVITVAGCILSLLGLLLVFFTFFLFQRWRRPLSNKILVNLCFAEFCSLTVFLAGVDQTANRPLCRGVAVALHYFIMASFGWMLVEAVHQYLNFVKVVGTYIPRFMWKASVCAWGVPVLPILAVLVYDSSLYDHDGSRELGTKICWMSSTGFWVAMLPPLASTMGVNLVMYGLILYGVTCGRPSVPSTLPERALLMNQLRMAVCVFFLLGLTWFFGLLAVSSARLVFSYLFCTFTTLKGFLLFVFHVCRERGARRYWEDFLSVLKHESSVSSPGDSAHAAHSAGRPGRLEASFTPCGGISVLPPLVARRTRPLTHTSLLSGRSSSTPNGSRASFYH